jgi:hypothetical protein
LFLLGFSCTKIIWFFNICQSNYKHFFQFRYIQDGVTRTSHLPYHHCRYFSNNLFDDIFACSFGKNIIVKIIFQLLIFSTFIINKKCTSKNSKEFHRFWLICIFKLQTMFVSIELYLISLLYALLPWFRILSWLIILLKITWPLIDGLFLLENIVYFKLINYCFQAWTYRNGLALHLWYRHLPSWVLHFCTTLKFGISSSWNCHLHQIPTGFYFNLICLIKIHSWCSLLSGWINIL